MSQGGAACRAQVYVTTKTDKHKQTWAQSKSPGWTADLTSGEETEKTVGEYGERHPGVRAASSWSGGEKRRPAVQGVRPAFCSQTPMGHPRSPIRRNGISQVRTFGCSTQFPGRNVRLTERQG